MHLSTRLNIWPSRTIPARVVYILLRLLGARAIVVVLSQYSMHISKFLNDYFRIPIDSRLSFISPSTLECFFHNAHIGANPLSIARTALVCWCGDVLLSSRIFCIPNLCMRCRQLLSCQYTLDTQSLPPRHILLLVRDSVHP